MASGILFVNGLHTGLAGPIPAGRDPILEAMPNA